MFGLLLSGRLVDTSFRSVDASHVLIDIDDVDSIHHVVVFLTGQQAFPDGMGGAVYFSHPSDRAPPWQFLGSLSNAKPSAIFRITGGAKPTRPHDVAQDLVSRFGGQHLDDGGGGRRVAQIGISMEPLTQLSGMVADTTTEATTVNSFAEFSQKMVENLFNYTSSFALSPGEMLARPNETFIPFSTLQQWYSNFERRLQQNPNFWRN